jgi:hypothetical protein
MSPLRRFLGDESGTATIEFIFMFPIVFTIFTASTEASLFMMRHVMFERAVDIVVRQEIALGNLDGVSHTDLKREICRTGMMVGSLTDCVDAMRIWMQPIDTTTLTMTAPPRSCVDRDEDIATPDPTGAEFAYGGNNDLMLMRVCWKEEPMFPTTAISIRMPVDPADGNYVMIATSAFVNEPG